MKRIFLLAALVLIAVVVVAHLYRPPGKVQLLANGVPCANLRGKYSAFNGPAMTDPNGILNLSSIPNGAEFVSVTLNDSAGSPVWSGIIKVPDRAGSLEIDIKKKRSEIVTHKLYLNFGIFAIKSEERTVWQELPQKGGEERTER